MLLQHLGSIHIGRLGGGSIERQSASGGIRAGVHLRWNLDEERGTVSGTRRQPMAVEVPRLFVLAKDVMPQWSSRH